MRDTRTTRVRRLAAHAAVLLVVGLLAACGGGATQLRPDGIQTEARQAYLNGLSELESGNFQEAIRYFQQVAASPSYFRYTALASLRVADSLFYQEQYARAVEAYQGFITRFAGNPNIPYAEFRVAQCHYRRMPGDWWFMPAAYEKDLSATRAAYDALTRYLRRHPRHIFAPQARRMQDFCADRLYDFELYVADYYEGRDRPRGVAQRLESALARFPERATRENLFVRLARAYAEAGDAKGTRSALERYLAAFPEGERSAEVRSWLEELGPAPAEGEAADDEAVPEETLDEDDVLDDEPADTEEPADDEPADDEPADDEPADDEPADDESDDTEEPADGDEPADE